MSKRITKLFLAVTIMMLSLLCGMGIKVEAAENNISLSKAITVVPDNNYTGTFLGDEDEKWYRFKTNENLSSYTFYASSGGSYIHFHLYDAYQAENPDAEMFDITSYGRNTTVKLKKNSVYYIKIEKSSVSDYVPYSFHFTSKTDEADSIKEAARIKSGTTKGILCTYDDVDYYKFQTNSDPGSYSFRLIGNDGSMHFCLYDKQGAELEDATMYYVGSAGDKKTVLLKGNSTYYIKVENNSWDPIDYTIVIIDNNKNNNPINSNPVKLSKTNISLIKNLKGKKVRLIWKKVAGCNGYEIQYSKDNSFHKIVKIKKIAGSKTVKTNINKLKKGKKYYIRIRAYRIVSGKRHYSGWSKIKTIKIKK